MKNNDDQILVSSLYLFYDFNKHKLVATTIANYPGMPFAVTPHSKSSEKFSYQLYSQNNLYYIILDGGVELTLEQEKVLSEVKDKVVGKDNISAINNYYASTITREEIHSLITEIGDYVSRHQLKVIADKQQYCHEELL